MNFMFKQAMRAGTDKFSQLHKLEKKTIEDDDFENLDFDLTKQNSFLIPEISSKQTSVDPEQELLQ